MKFCEMNQYRCAIILAGGDGTRPSEVTRRITGEVTPKQLYPVIGTTSLLERTRLRVSLTVHEGRILTVPSRTHERPYHLFTDKLPQQNRGTASAILCALLRLTKVARDASVALFPSDQNKEADYARQHTSFLRLEAGATDKLWLFDDKVNIADKCETVRKECSEQNKIMERKPIAEADVASIRLRRLELHEDGPLVVAQCVLCADLARGFRNTPYGPLPVCYTHGDATLRKPVPP